jgi:hypothetical protein
MYIYTYIYIYIYICVTWCQEGCWSLCALPSAIHHLTSAPNASELMKVARNHVFLMNAWKKPCTSTHTHIHVHMHTHTQTHTDPHTHTQTFTRTGTHKNTHEDTHKYTHNHTDTIYSSDKGYDAFNMCHKHCSRGRWTDGQVTHGPMSVSCFALEICGCMVSHMQNSFLESRRWLASDLPCLMRVCGHSPLRWSASL